MLVGDEGVDFGVAFEPVVGDESVEAAVISTVMGFINKE